MDSYPNNKPPAGGRGRRVDGLLVDRDAEVPLGLQLTWSLRSRIGSGELAAGERLPGLRELAEAVGVNVNTARAVYQRLEHEGLIDSHQGSGTFVAGAPRGPSVAGAIAADAARAALSAGVDPREVSTALYVAEASDVKAGAEAGERRRVLRMQIAALERTLGEMEASHPGLAPPPAPATTPAGPTLLNSDELEHVRTTLVRRLAALQSAIDGVSPDTDDTQRPASGEAPARKQAKSTHAVKPKRKRARGGAPRPAAGIG
jgi:DNA-binding transcriptional regulator YhcF (GntR family)